MAKGIKAFGDRADLLALVEREIVRLKKLSKASGGVDAATVKRYDALRTAAKNYRAAIGGLNIADLTARLKEIKGDKEAKEEAAILNDWLKLSTREADLKKALKETEAALDALAYAKYPKLTEAEIKTLVVEDKWMAAIAAAIHGEMDRISQALAQRVKELAERYETPLPQAALKVVELEAKVNTHLAKMGFQP